MKSTARRASSSDLGLILEGFDLIPPVVRGPFTVRVSLRLVGVGPSETGACFPGSVAAVVRKASVRGATVTGSVSDGRENFAVGAPDFANMGLETSVQVTITRWANAKSGASIVVNGSGTVSFKKGADGKTRYRVTGPYVLYFFPGDEGPFGKVGENGALYHVVGKVGETLAKDDVVTAFVLRGRATELCSKIA